MSKQRLLICFDAFGTLFTPKRPVHQQYTEVARSLGLGSVHEADVEKHFKDAFKKEATQNPNFGKANGMNAEQWWTNIIVNTFRPIVGNDKQLPKDLVPKLLHRFWSDEGYNLMPDVQSLFRRLKSRFHHGDATDVVVGVVTNSDDRVPDILSSLGLKVSPVRYGQGSPAAAADQKYDIDFSVMSFDVGHEKPDARIFKAAEEMIGVVCPSTSENSKQNSDAWEKIYVGDEYKKDVAGAVNAGWNAILIGPRDEVNRHEDVKWLDDQPVGKLRDVFEDARSIGFSRLSKLAERLPGEL